MAKTKDGDKKKATGKKGTKKASNKGGTKKSPSKAMAAAAPPQTCFSMATANLIVGGCLLPGSHHNDDTLEQTGLINGELRRIFRECVFNGVDARGCEIGRGQIPNSGDTEVGTVIDAVFNNSRPK
jgi:hypothetical protein